MRTLEIYSSTFVRSECDSRLSTLRSVCDDSRIFIYAASVSLIVRSNSVLAVIFFARFSLILANFSLEIRISFSNLCLSSSSIRICRCNSSRFAHKSSIPMR